MKAKTIKKLRKQIKSYKIFYVDVCIGSFGFHYRIGKNDCKVIKALNDKHAIAKYMKWCWRRYKKRNIHQKGHYTETTQKWGEIVVMDEKGYMRFYE